MSRCLCRVAVARRLSLLRAAPRFSTAAQQQVAQSTIGRQVIVCNGCGITLQTRNQVAAGYIPSLKRLELLEQRAAQLLDSSLKYSSHGVICQRCFSAKHYGRLMPLELPAEEYQGYLNALLSTPEGAGSGGRGRGEKEEAASGGGGGRLVLWCVDLLDFHGGLLPHMLKQLLGSGTPVLLVLNKVDLLPHSAPFSRVETWTRRQLRLAGVPAAKLAGRQIHLLSAARQTGTVGLLRDVRELSRGKDVYVAGAPNAGACACPDSSVCQGQCGVPSHGL